MSVLLEQTAEQAHRLVETGEVTAAQAMLREALATVEPDPAHATPVLAAAASLYARVLVTLNEPSLARRWAAYAHTASRRLHGPSDERTMQAASVLANVLHRAGAYSRAAYLYRELVDQLTARDGPRSSVVLAARADLATVLHARGGCADARSLLTKTWTAYRYLYGEADPIGIKMLARLGAMERDCGMAAQAAERFELAETLCRQHLPPGHRLAGQIAALTRLPADQRHTCEEPLAPNGSGEAHDLAGTIDWWPPEPPASAPAPPPIPQPAAAPAATPAAEKAPEESSKSTEVVPRSSQVVHKPRHLRVRRPPRHIRQRTTLATVGTLSVVIVTVLTVATGALIAQARQDGSARQAAPPVVPAVNNPPPSAAASPPPSAAATTPPATRSPVGGGAAQAPAPPTGVKLSDGGGSVTLAWTYPAGAKGQVILSAGRPGKPRTTIQTLPAGTSSFTVYGLSSSGNYCFSIGVAYSSKQVLTARPVCTAR